MLARNYNTAVAMGKKKKNNPNLQFIVNEWVPAVLVIYISLGVSIQLGVGRKLKTKNLNFYF